MSLSCVAHDRNDHVQRGDCCEEGGQDEEEEADFALRADLILLYRVEVAERHQVLVDEDVEDKAITVGAEDLRLVSARVRVENEHGRPEGKKKDREDGEEGQDIFHSRQDQRNVERCLVEHSEPIEELSPHENH